MFLDGLLHLCGKLDFTVDSTRLSDHELVFMEVRIR